MNNAFTLASVVIKELYRRKDFYVLFILTALLTLLLGLQNVFNDDRIVRQLKEVCLLLIWISTLLIAITTAARQIPSERENRTIFPLLAKPVTRAEVLAGKFLGCWFASGLCLLVFYAFFTLLTGARSHHWPLVNYAQALWLHWLLLAVIIAATLLGSVVLTTPAANATITFITALGILSVGAHLNKVALRNPEPVRTLLSALYFAIPHLEFFDARDLITHDWPAIQMRYLAGATIYAAVYTAFFLFAAWLVFRRKALN